MTPCTLVNSANEICTILIFLNKVSFLVCTVTFIASAISRFEIGVKSVLFILVTYFKKKDFRSNSLVQALNQHARRQYTFTYFVKHLLHVKFKKFKL